MFCILLFLFLTLKVPIMTAADRESDTQQMTFTNIFSLFFRENKTWCFKWILWKIKPLFSSKDKSKKLKCCLLQFLFGALRVKCLSWFTWPLNMEVMLGNLQKWQSTRGCKWVKISGKLIKIDGWLAISCPFQQCFSNNRTIRGW